MKDKPGIVAARAGKIIKIALSQEQTTKPGMFGNVQRKPTTQADSKSRVKQVQNGKAKQGGTNPNIPFLKLSGLERYRHDWGDY